jgi:Protein of unknown function (DUF3159)
MQPATLPADGPSVTRDGLTDRVHLDLPGVRGLVRHALPAIVEGSVIPLAIFLLTLRLLGLRGAIVAGLFWSFGNVARRSLTRRRVPGIVLLGALTVTVRAALGLATGSAFVYFLQPTLGTALVGALFLVSVGIGRPLALRLVGDFCPIPDGFAEHSHVRRFFGQITLLWAVTQLTTAAITLWLLLTQPLETFLIARTVVALSLTVAAVGLSVLWFRRSMPRHGIFLRWRPSTGTPAVLVSP